MVSRIGYRVVNSLFFHTSLLTVIVEVGLSDVDGTQFLPLTNGNTGFLGCDCPTEPGLTEGTFRVVHDGTVVVRCAHVADPCRVLLEVHPVLLFDVIIMNSDVLVTVRSALFVEESEGVTDLVNNDSILPTTFAQVQRLTSSGPPHVGRTDSPISTDEVHVVTIRTSFLSERDAGILGPLFHGILDVFLGITEPTHYELALEVLMDDIGYHATRPPHEQRCCDPLDFNLASQF